MKTEAKQTKGQLLARSFRPFLSPGIKKESDVDPTIDDMAKAIDSCIHKEVEQVILRVRQLLSAMDYEKLTDYQSKCVLLLEKEIKKATE